MRDDRERLRDILEAVERIDRYARDGRERFETDELVQTWIVHNLQIIGESCRTISVPFREAHSEIPWSRIIGMRNILVHDYFGIDTDVVWEAVEKEIPQLRERTRAILEQ